MDKWFLFCAGKSNGESIPPHSAQLSREGSPPLFNQTERRWVSSLIWTNQIERGSLSYLAHPTRGGSPLPFGQTKSIEDPSLIWPSRMERGCLFHSYIRMERDSSPTRPSRVENGIYSHLAKLNGERALSHSATQMERGCLSHLPQPNGEGISLSFSSVLDKKKLIHRVYESE